MKIAYILNPEVIVSNKSNGVRSQAEDWGKMLEERGHIVEYVNSWGNYDWKVFDIIHLFGDRDWAYYVGSRLRRINDNVVYSPICDPPSTFKYWKEYIRYAIHYLTFGVYKWPRYLDRKIFSVFKAYFVRSEFEKDYICNVYGVKPNLCKLVRLGYSSSCKQYESVIKDDFCLHISSIHQERKNVVRLIEAAKKYNFNLVLAGNKGSDKEYYPIKQAIGGSQNIKVLGFVSEEEKIELYKKAKVFALPSLLEGVGIVALDAAFYGCEIVITNIPGPKDYYNGMCEEINPYCVDGIGKGIMNFLLDKKHYQPKLGEYVRSNYNTKCVYDNLFNAYTSLI